MSEDTIWTIISVALLLGALSIGHFFKSTKGMKIFITLMTPFTWLKDRIDPNYWANRIGGKKGGVYEKALNSETRKWVDSLEGWKWWTWQLGVGLIGVILVEYILNLIGMTMLPWR